MNRVVYDDIVVIEMLKEEDWICSLFVIFVYIEEKDDIDEEEEKEVCVIKCVVYKLMIFIYFYLF